MHNDDLDQQLNRIRDLLGGLQQVAGELTGLQDQLPRDVVAELAIATDHLQDAIAKMRQPHPYGQEFRSVDPLEGVAQAYWETDMAGTMQMANPAAAALFAMPAEQLVGRALSEFVAPESWSAIAQQLPLDQSLSPAPWLGVCLCPWLGPPVFGLLTLVPIRQGLEQAAGRGWLFYDMTNLRQTELDLRRQLDQAYQVGAIARRIRQLFDPQTILDVAAVEIQQFLQADRVVVYCSAIKQEASIAVAEAVMSGWSSVLGSTIQTTAIESWLQSAKGAFTVLEDVQHGELPPAWLQLLKQHQVKSALLVPVRQAEQLLGILVVQQCRTLNRWPHSDLEALLQVVEQVAIAIQQAEFSLQVQQLNADLEQEVQRRTQQVQRALDFESMLKRITDKVRDSLDEAQILQTVVEELTLVLGLGGCNAALYDLSQGTSTIRYEYADSIPTYRGRVAQMDNFPEIYHQLHQGLCFQFCSLIPNPNRGRVSMLACPIFVDVATAAEDSQGVLGDLWLIHHKDYVFSEFEIRLVQQVANHCAIAIRQARLYQSAQVQVQELERLNRLKDEFLSTVSHELRTPISNVKMAIYMLKHATTEARRQQYLNILETESAREAELINDLLDLQQLEATAYPLELESIHLQNWLPRLIEPFHARIANHQQRLHIDLPNDLPILISDSKILGRILSELLNNACKYTPANHEIRLQIDLQPPPAPAPAPSLAQDRESVPSLTITLQNQATIPPGELPNIFAKFYRVPNADPWKQGGTGLGLALVQKFVAQLQGTIQVESIHGWTIFTLCLPLDISYSEDS